LRPWCSTAACCGAARRGACGAAARSADDARSSVCMDLVRRWFEALADGPEWHSPLLQPVLHDIIDEARLSGSRVRRALAHSCLCSWSATRATKRTAAPCRPCPRRWVCGTVCVCVVTDCRLCDVQRCGLRASQPARRRRRSGARHRCVRCGRACRASLGIADTGAPAGVAVVRASLPGLVPAAPRREPAAPGAVCRRLCLLLFLCADAARAGR
jgi:hypothetical protein